jgi:hypothetical protein
MIKKNRIKEISISFDGQMRYCHVLMGILAISKVSMG